MSFEDLGARLRALRESRGHDLEDVARHIKLSERTLLSIEEGRQNDLPHPVYAKGFIRAYARFLGMSAEEIAESLAEAFPAEEDDNAAPVKVLHQPKRKSSAYGTVVILFILAVLAIGSWYFYSNVISKNEELPATPVIQSSIADPDEEQAQTESSGAKLPEGVVSVSGSNVEAGLAAENSSNATSLSETTLSDSESENSNLNSDVVGPIYFESGRGASENETRRTQPSVTSPGRKHRVVITATEECWIKATTDKGDERPFNLPKNQSSVFTFDEFLKLRLGNVAGVKIRYNGRDFPIPPGSNTRDLIFPPKAD